MTNTGDSSDVYFVFMVEPLHLLLLGIFEKMKECIAAYLSSIGKIINFLTPQQKKEKKTIQKMTILHEYNNLLAAYKRDFSVPSMQEDLSTSQKLGWIIGPFAASGLKKVLKGKDYLIVDMFFSFATAYLDRTLERFQAQGLTKIHKFYFNIDNLLLYYNSETRTAENMRSKWTEKLIFWKLIQQNCLIIWRASVCLLKSFICLSVLCRTSREFVIYYT